MTLLNLPPEIHVLITEHFDWHSLLHYRHTCKYFRDITETLSLEQVWHQVWSLNLSLEITMQIYYTDFLSKYKETYAICLTIFTTTYCQGIELPADISAFRRTYDYLGKVRMFEMYKEIQTTHGFSLIALGSQICRRHFMLTDKFIVVLELMCLEILDYIFIHATDESEIKQWLPILHRLLRNAACRRGAHEMQVLDSLLEIITLESLRTGILTYRVRV